MFEFTVEQKLFGEMIRRWAEENLVPALPDLELGRSLPYDLMRDFMATLGLDEMVRKRYQGTSGKEKPGGSPAPSYDPGWEAMIAIELSRVCPGFMLAFGASTGLAGRTVMARGTDRQKARWGIPLLTADLIGAWAVTEPGAGSDAFGGMLTKASRVEGGYLLNGQKTFITNAPDADVMVVYARTETGDESPENWPVHAFVLDRGTPGLRTTGPMRKMGMHASPTGEIFMEDCRVTEDNLLTGGRGGDTARQQVKATFKGERTTMLPMCFGIIDYCLEVSVAYAKERKTWGQSIGTYQLIKEKLAAMFVHRENVLNLLFKSLHRSRNRVPLTTAEASCGKLYAARAATEVALEAIQVMGGNGYMAENRVEMLMRDAKLLQIGGGTDEIQIGLIARQLLTEESH